MAKTFNQLVSDYKTISRDSSSGNETLGKQLLRDFIREILYAEDWTFNRGTSTANTVADQQYYNLPYNCWRLRKVTITVDSTTYTPREVKDEKMWSILNSVSSSSNVPTYFYVKPSTNQVGFYPVPSEDNNTITYSFQKKILDYGASDYTTGTISVNNGSDTVTGSGTSWSSDMVGRHIKISDFWYEITAVNSTTELEIRPEFGGSNVSGDSYQISELVPLPDGFENLPLWKALAIYFQSRDSAGSRVQANQYLTLYLEGLEQLYRRDAKTTSEILKQGDIYLPDINRYPEITT